MLIERYFEAIQAHLEKLSVQLEPIQEAARLCADALGNGGAVHIFDSGHLVSHELVNRAGGLVALSHLSFGLTVTNPVKSRSDAPNPHGLSYRYIEHVFETNQLRAGDVLFVGSVSGKTANVVELSLQAQAHGLKVVAITSLAYSSQLASEHPSGMRLFETTKVVLDNGAPYGDAMLTVEGMEYGICPASGIGAATLMWAVVAGIVEEMLNRGQVPTIFPSVNRPDGRELVTQAENTARQKGF